MEDSHVLLPYVHRVASGSHLSSAEARDAMNLLLTGADAPEVVGGYLVALHMKGETASELAGFARAKRECMVVVDAGGGPNDDLIDIVGTGGDGAGTFNISTVAAMVLAGAGARVAKHGNRAISGKSRQRGRARSPGNPHRHDTGGSGLRAVREIGLGFLFAPHFASGHEKMSRGCGAP